MKNHGFTLIELMIVILVISIIAAIAIPNLLSSRRNANEASAMQALRTIGTSQALYLNSGMRTNTAGVSQYGNLSQLGSSTPPFIDSALSTGSKSGYTFTISVSDDVSNPSFTVNAGPAQYPTTGFRTFSIDREGVIRFNIDGTQASATSAPLN